MIPRQQPVPSFLLTERRTLRRRPAQSPRRPSQTPDTAPVRTSGPLPLMQPRKPESNKSGSRNQAPRLAFAAPKRCMGEPTGLEAKTSEDGKPRTCEASRVPFRRQLRPAVMLRTPKWHPSILASATFQPMPFQNTNSHKHLAAFSSEASSSGPLHSFTAAIKNSKANYRTMAQEHGRRGNLIDPARVQSRDVQDQLHCIALRPKADGIQPPGPWSGVPYSVLAAN